MKRLMRRVSERLVGLVLPKTDAGACVPEHGDCCKAGYSFNCYGYCVNKSSIC